MREIRTEAYIENHKAQQNGQQSIGTPAHTPSIVEFHPLCVKNPPIEGWFNTSS